MFSRSFPEVIPTFSTCQHTRNTRATHATTTRPRCAPALSACCPTVRRPVVKSAPALSVLCPSHGAGGPSMRSGAHGGLSQRPAPCGERRSGAPGPLSHPWRRGAHVMSRALAPARPLAALDPRAACCPLFWWRVGLGRLGERARAPRARPAVPSPGPRAAKIHRPGASRPGLLPGASNNKPPGPRPRRGNTAYGPGAGLGPLTSARPGRPSRRFAPGPLRRQGRLGPPGARRRAASLGLLFRPVRGFSIPPTRPAPAEYRRGSCCVVAVLVAVGAVSASVRAVSASVRAVSVSVRVRPPFPALLSRARASFPWGRRSCCGCARSLFFGGGASVCMRVTALGGSCPWGSCSTVGRSFGGQGPHHRHLNPRPQRPPACSARPFHHHLHHLNGRAPPPGRRNTSPGSKTKQRPGLGSVAVGSACLRGGWCRRCLPTVGAALRAVCASGAPSAPTAPGGFAALLASLAGASGAAPCLLWITPGLVHGHMYCGYAPGV